MVSTCRSSVKRDIDFSSNAFQGRLESEKVTVQDDIAVAGARSDYLEDEKKRTEASTADLRGHVSVHQEMYKKAVKDMPTGRLYPFHPRNARKPPLLL